MTWAGLSAGVMSTRALVANIVGVPSMRPASTALSMFFLSADAKTSARAPPFNWSTRPEEPSKEYCAGAMVGNTVDSDAAANTTGRAGDVG